jgi:tetratricopeptide (TPR) repeat protein
MSSWLQSQRFLPLALAIFVLPGAFAQRGNTGAGSRGSTTPSIPNTTTPNNTPGTNTPGINTPGNNRNTLGTTENPNTSGMPMPIFLSGRVLFDDGTKPNTNIVIQRVCFGNPIPETHADSHGRFSFQVGQNQAAISDASVDSSSQGMPLGYGGRQSSNQEMTGMGLSQAMTERQLQRCEIQAAYPGYRSDVISLATHRSLDSPDLGVIVLHRLSNVQGTTISMTSALAPKKARKAYEKGLQLASKGKLDDAEKHMQEAVTVYPKYAEAWYQLGRLQQARQDLAEAKKSYTTALQSDSKYVSPYDQLAVLAAQEGKWQEAADQSRQAVSLNPVEFPGAWYLNALANYNLKHADAAKKSAEETLRVDGRHKFPQAETLLAQIYADKGDYPAAAAHLQTYLKLRPDAQNAALLKQQLSKLQDAIARTKK